ncbi:MAG: hypothetical protein EBT86_03885 [Actinobacteria bacterium]|nr:hypothetical protein [Actinomycetota bacterium]
MYPAAWNGTPSTTQQAVARQNANTIVANSARNTGVSSGDRGNKDPSDEIIFSRRGYDARELLHSFSVNLLDTGPLASGKLLHYTADLICSGGIELLRKLCWDFAFDHIGVAQPRIFIFLRKRISDIFAAWQKQSQETFLYSAENQKIIAEMVLVLQACPRRTKPKIPVVSSDTHENDLWLRSSLRATEKESVRKVFKHGIDQHQMYHAANEIIHATQEGGTERALWWLRWLIEEDNAVRQRNKVGLTTLERGVSSSGRSGGGKRKGLMGAYVAAVLAECYKELAGKGLIRLHDEFQCLLDLSRIGHEVGLTPKKQTDCLALMIQILAEIPRWKNPSCPPLLTLNTTGSQGGFQSSGTDDLALARAVSQAEIFWREILALPPLEKSLPTAIKAKAAAVAQRKKNAKKGDVSEKMSQMDQFYLNFYNI